MQEINWNIFRAKFNGKEQSTFEWLCYLLFRKEFKKHVGISRYKNQAGVETNPIKINGIWLGWQAKFYDTPLSAHKTDFIESISTAKCRHPEINEIIFYTNKDFGQDRIKTDPEYKKEIEKHAKSSKVKIVWRTASFFESPFVCEENSQIAQHFFSLQRSLIDLINDLTRRTESFLDHIQSKIDTNGKEIKINRTWIIEKIQQNLTSSSLIILSGKAGVGKTAVIKDFYDLEKGKKPFFVFKATEFNISNVNLLFKDYGIFSFSDFINAYKDFIDKLILIDSATGRYTTL